MLEIKKKSDLFKQEPMSQDFTVNDIEMNLRRVIFCKKKKKIFDLKMVLWISPI